MANVNPGDVGTRHGAYVQLGAVDVGSIITEVMQGVSSIWTSYNQTEAEKAKAEAAAKIAAAGGAGFSIQPYIPYIVGGGLLLLVVAVVVLKR